MPGKVAFEILIAFLLYDVVVVFGGDDVLEADDVVGAEFVLDHELSLQCFQLISPFP